MLRIAPLTPDDEPAAYEIDRAAFEVDAPGFPVDSLTSFRSRLHTPWPGRVTETYLATSDTEPVGYLSLGLPQLDNLANVNMQLSVQPGQRRRGVGRALHAFAKERARTLGREYLISAACGQEAFATAMGAVTGLSELRSRLDVSAAVLDDSPIAAGYRLVQWVDDVPEEHVADIACLDSRLNEDAPTGDLNWEPEKVDAERIRASEEALRRREITAFHTGAVSVASGRMVAWTTIAGPDDASEQAWQNITIVDPAHRGHRLGLAVKSANFRLALARRPELRAVDTFNAAENTHMLRINRQMGFRVVEEWTQWQQTV